MYPRLLHVLWVWSIYLDPPKSILFQNLIYPLNNTKRHLTMNYYLQTRSSINHKHAIQQTKLITNKENILIDLKEGKQQNISSLIGTWNNMNTHSRILTWKGVLTILSVFLLALLVGAALILPNILLYRMIPLICKLIYLNYIS
jgi:hypothetical protein